MDIRNWEELSKVPPSETHMLRVDAHIGGADIYTLDGKYCHYLSTHLFYGGEPSVQYAKTLKKCGFDINIITQ